MRVIPLTPLMAVLALTLAPQSLLAAAEGDAAKGRALLDANCARCHAIGPDDASKHDKAPPFREVVTRYPLQDLEESLAEGIMSGHPDMPEVSFKADEIAAILNYLGQLKPNAAAPADKPDAEPAAPAQP